MHRNLSLNIGSYNRYSSYDFCTSCLFLFNFFSCCPFSLQGPTLPTDLVWWHSNAHTLHLPHTTWYIHTSTFFISSLLVISAPSMYPYPIQHLIIWFIDTIFSLLLKWVTSFPIPQSLELLLLPSVQSNELWYPAATLWPQINKTDTDVKFSCRTCLVQCFLTMKWTAPNSNWNFDVFIMIEDDKMKQIIVYSFIIIICRQRTWRGAVVGSDHDFSWLVQPQVHWFILFRSYRLHLF